MLQIHRLIAWDDEVVREYVLDAPTYLIGRSPKCGIRFSSPYVSRRHATLVQRFREDGSNYYHIVDGSSKNRPSMNGSMINGYKLQSHDLEDGDVVVLGARMRFRYFVRKIENGATDKCNFLLKCSQTWDDLEETSWTLVRYCLQCQQEVFHAEELWHLLYAPDSYKCFFVKHLLPEEEQS
ncbi:FHA domain-containing protein [Trichocoleus sp. FACHB-591]|uniref:FHA domain-containing protein n=1 Tax=Trichocoleus sp. FACHB-591 TaxID=2692872 RepID=UPI0016889FFA|nr:FHA domain-containing protein [Trichocoleus sp. FACHB-591]MBD2093580.1 FHA domain-containing protein [Trichocoleus sp. FACHB-591]